MINAAEKGSDLQLSGTTSGVEAGQTITVIFGGKSYTTTVAADNTWGLTIPVADVATLPDGAANVQASVSNVAGNSAQATHAYSVGGKTYTATVQGNLSWSVNVPAADIQAIGNGDLTVNASVTNGVGNTGSGSRDITIDANLPGLRVDTVAGDDVVNSIEHAGLGNAAPDYRRARRISGTFGQHSRPAAVLLYFQRGASGDEVVWPTARLSQRGEYRQRYGRECAAKTHRRRVDSRTVCDGRAGHQMDVNQRTVGGFTNACRRWLHRHHDRAEHSRPTLPWFAGARSDATDGSSAQQKN